MEKEFRNDKGYEFLKRARGKKRSQYAADKFIPIVDVCPAIFYGLKKYQDIIDNSNGSIAVDKCNRYLIEYVIDNEVECAVYNPESGKIIASGYSTSVEVISGYDIEFEDCSLLILAIMEVILEDDEARGCYNYLLMGLSDADFISDQEEFINQLALLCDNILQRTKLKNQPYTIRTELNDLKINRIDIIPDASIKSAAYDVDRQIVGITKIFKGNAVRVNAMTAENLNGAYKFSNNKYEIPVAKIDDSYLIPDTIIEICKLVKESTDLAPAMRNILLYGDSGSGKTEGAFAMAAAFAMPYMTYVCNPQTDNFDLIGQFVPVTENSTKILSLQDLLCSKMLPTLEDVKNEPRISYMKLTGTSKDDIDQEQVYQILFEKVFNIINEETHKISKDFIFVQSEIVEALKHGYLVEIQEPTVIVNEGVLVGLNSVLAGGHIQLATGERIFRHPDSVIVFTTNTPDYAGYGNFSNSVLSRCSLMYEMNTPSVDEMAERAIAKTKLSDTSIVMKMAECVTEISLKVKERGLKDGSCGFRELINWITAYRITGKWIESAIPTVINKATFKADIREEIKTIVQFKE